MVRRENALAGLRQIAWLTAVLVGLYLLRVLFRFLSNYLAHKAAWYLVGDLRTKTYDKLEHMHLGYFHDKQTGDLMSRVVNDTRDFELLYAHMIPETITNLVTFAGALIILLTINWKLALITCAPIPLIMISGVIFSKKVRPFFRISQKKMGELNGKLQDTCLFNGTIAENIGYAVSHASMEEIMDAARAANIHEDILAMFWHLP